MRSCRVRPTKSRFLLLLGLGVLALPVTSFALGQPSYIASSDERGSFRLVQGNDAAPLWVDAGDYPGVVRAAGDLQADLVRVTGAAPALIHEEAKLGATPVIIGTLGKSRILD